MRWRNRRQSTNVEDRRRMSPGKAAVGGGAGMLVILAIALLFGADPRAILEQTQAGGLGGPGSAGGSRQGQAQPIDDEAKEFLAVVLADTEEVWGEVFRTQLSRNYEKPNLVLFTGQVRSACGFANAAVGPFYCPADKKAYLDTSFFSQLKQRFGAPGDFAQAYVVAHEIGHHVQNLLGISEEVNNQRRRLSKEEYNRLSVRMELQADFLAGVWAHHAHRAWGILEKGDVEEALRAATAIGDDNIQRQSQGYVVPESFTHGTSEQRVRWFHRGLETGDLSQGDTFNARQL